MSLELDLREVFKKLNYSNIKYNNCSNEILSTITQVKIKVRKKGIGVELYTYRDQYGKEQYITLELLSFLDAIILFNEVEAKFPSFVEKGGEFEEIFPSFVEKGRVEFYIPAGDYYTGIKILRKILMMANKEITIIDNFLHPEILILVEIYLDKDKVNIVKFLTRKKNNKNFNSFISDLEKFRKQYSNFQIEARHNNKFHDRYIIIDGNIVYHSGHSFYDLGKKGSGISRMEDEGEISKFLDDFNNLWDTGKTI